MFWFTGVDHCRDSASRSLHGVSRLGNDQAFVAVQWWTFFPTHYLINGELDQFFLLLINNISCFTFISPQDSEILVCVRRVSGSVGWRGWGTVGSRLTRTGLARGGVAGLAAQVDGYSPWLPVSAPVRTGRLDCAHRHTVRPRTGRFSWLEIWGIFNGKLSNVLRTFIWAIPATASNWTLNSQNEQVAF